MKVSRLVEKCEGFLAYGKGALQEATFLNLEYDSRNVSSQTLFVAVQGYEIDGHDFVAHAVEMGASVVLVSRERVSDFASEFGDRVVVLCAADTRRALSKVSSVFYDEPSSKLHVTGVTGTNGKTSFTYLLESVYKSAGLKCGVMGTVNYRWGENVMDAPNTTPESRDVQEILSMMYDSGVTHVIMEVSSHALDLGRVLDVEFDTAVFTNLTGDHLDFHGDMDSYFDAKMKLFEQLASGSKKSLTAVLNGEDCYSEKIEERLCQSNVKILKYGMSSGLSIEALGDSMKNRITGFEYTLGYDGEKFPVSLGLCGKFQMFNSLAAFGAAIAAGLDAKSTVSGLENLKNVPGRLEVIDSGLGFCVIVDYAHTSDALLKLLQSVNEMDHGRIITVFGCGGDRDKTKRPEMGGIALANSHVAIVTSDNPRTETPGDIIEDIVKGMDGGNYEVEVDRERAIEEAVSMAQEGDIIVIAGKGHEDYQILGVDKIHFDDREMARKYIAGRLEE